MTKILQQLVRPAAHSSILKKVNLNVKHRKDRRTPVNTSKENYFFDKGLTETHFRCSDQFDKYPHGITFQKYENVLIYAKRLLIVQKHLCTSLLNLHFQVMAGQRRCSIISFDKEEFCLEVNILHFLWPLLHMRNICVVQVCFHKHCNFA